MKFIRHTLQKHAVAVFSILFLIGLGIIYITNPALAAPFAPGATLDPGCSPGDVDCTTDIDQDLGEVLTDGNTTGGTDVSFGTDKALFGSGVEIYDDSGDLTITNTDSGNIFLNKITGTTVNRAHLTTGMFELNQSGLASTGGLDFNFGTITPPIDFNSDINSNGTLIMSSLTSGRTWTLPDNTGTVALLSDITGGTLAQTLVIGSTTGGTDIDLTTGDAIKDTTNTGTKMTMGSGFIQFDAVDGISNNYRSWLSNTGFSIFDTVTGESIKLAPTANKIQFVNSSARTGALDFSSNTVNRTWNLPNLTGEILVAASTLTAGSIPFVGTSGIISENSSNLSWNNSNNRLSINSAMRLVPLSGSQPASAVAGNLYVDGDNGNELCFYDGSAWQAVITGTDTNCD